MSANAEMIRQVIRSLDRTRKDDADGLLQATAPLGDKSCLGALFNQDMQKNLFVIWNIN